MFNEAERININGIIKDRFYQQQIMDTRGKDEIDEKIIAEVTGAKEPL